MVKRGQLLQVDNNGLHCRVGGFYIDPWRPVERAIITHAHSDHARWGCKSYLTSTRGEKVLRERVGRDSLIETLDYNSPTTINGVTISLHPAGHILGSSQIRVEYNGEIWGVSGDYKTVGDKTCDPFEPVPCHTFISESTFGLPIYRWTDEDELYRDMNAWWRENRENNRVSVIFAYALGKAQRVLAGLDQTIGPIFVHGAVKRFVEVYRSEGVPMPEVIYATQENVKEAKGKAMIVAPPSAAGTPWLRKFGPASTAFASGWMAIRGARRRRALDRGFIMSDHADWEGLLAAVKATGAERIGVTHGYTAQLTRYLNEKYSLETFVIPTRYVGETGEGAEDEADTPETEATP